MAVAKALSCCGPGRRNAIQYHSGLKCEDRFSIVVIPEPVLTGAFADGVVLIFARHLLKGEKGDLFFARMFARTKGRAC